MREILSDIFMWQWLSEKHGYNFNGHLICHDDGNICIDPVEPSEDIINKIVGLGVSHILLTNRNHSRSANLIRERTGARTAIHPDDGAHARSQGTTLDEDLGEGQKIGPLVVIGVPGKSPGEVAFHWPERRLLIVGDVVIGNPPGQCGLLRETVMDNPQILKESVRSLLKLDFHTLLVGDGKPILHNAKNQLEKLIENFPK